MESPGTMYECNICLEQATDPVVTRCGHLFCWGCLHQWLTIPRRSPVHGGLQPSSGTSMCPVCKAAVSTQTVTPIYSRGTSKDPRAADPHLPARPQGEWQEPEPESRDAQEAFAYGGTNSRYTFTAGYGQFPVVCSLVCRGSSARSLFDLPMASKKAQLGISALTCIAVVSM